MCTITLERSTLVEILIKEHFKKRSTSNEAAVVWKCYINRKISNAYSKTNDDKNYVFVLYMQLYIIYNTHVCMSTKTFVAEQKYYARCFLESCLLSIGVDIPVR